MTGIPENETANRQFNSLVNIAITKGHIYAQEYDPNSGRIKDKQGYHYIKEGYTKGFLDGVAYRMSGGHDAS